MEANTQSAQISTFPFLLQVHRTSRQALQLLEYLVKNGSEHVVDDARSHISTVKLLRNFYYVDDKYKDQGINGW